MKVLIVEDNTKLGAVIHEAMTRAHFVSDWAKSLEDAELLRGQAEHDLILLDLGLPDGDGLAFLRDLRAANVHTPVIVLTARGGLNDKIAGLEEGADDYLVKPFQLAEMVSRCRAVLRRPDRMTIEPLQSGRLEYDLSTGTLTVDGVKSGLARREQQLLGALMRRADKVSSRAYLEGAIYENGAEVSPNAMEVSISRLRTYLLAVDAGVEVRTVRGIGYILSVPTNA